MNKLLNEKCSLIFKDKYYSYEYISREVAKWQYIIKNQLRLENSTIMLYLEISDEVIFLILAILSTNNGYIPVDINMPYNRLQSMLQQSNVDIVITNAEYINLFRDNEVFNIDNLNEVTPEYGQSHFNNKIGSRLAYTIFTSGSTGNPKGVNVNKSAVANFVNGTKRAIDFSGCTSIICVSSVSFDIFFLETIYALHMGLKVVLASHMEQKNPRLILKLITKYKVDTLQITPSRLYLLQILDPFFKNLCNLKLLIIGGENIPLNLLKDVQNNTAAEIYNAYGPTETTIWISYSNLTKQNKVDIGTPIDNNNFYLLDDNMHIVDEGSIGELYITGSNLADEYINNIEETNKRFKYIFDSNIRAYKTGDLCKKVHGKYYWVGRVDNQIKIRGYRIELEDIEKIICAYKDIKEAIVLLISDDNTNRKYLVGVLTCKNSYKEEHFYQFMKDRLPKYMMPDFIRCVDRFPHTISGKVDRNKLKSIIKEQFFSKEL